MNEMLVNGCVFVCVVLTCVMMVFVVIMFVCCSYVIFICSYAHLREPMTSDEGA